MPTEMRLIITSALHVPTLSNASKQPISASRKRYREKGWVKGDVIHTDTGVMGQILCKSHPHLLAHFELKDTHQHHFSSAR